ncbi:hypothetical protein [Faecalibaculum rodentium]|uniref:hypothetical protein n=1 Tax=Faecalibaculum rodentium TaxID=1702221 RepID=UPI0023F0B5C8|nr:hypothetical protein [Faecalibaculum rodentium]
MTERKYKPENYDIYVAEFMEKVYQDAEKWKKSGSISDKIDLENDMLALRTSIKVIASEGEISCRQRDDMLGYFLGFLA